ncbi:hypothetical protein INT43_003066 [Umbelopsis isabellina]|uniref:Uncharacterized protein n=1 Tax=Mortierella isabellina TaxID=91625 RepID=A0A8H7UFX7_MORIS|nr:hypothetical protein INT43_003066 [Umbelopsis isabellina]
MNEHSMDKSEFREHGGTKTSQIAHAEAAMMAGKAYEVRNHEGHNKQYDTFEDYVNSGDHEKHEGQPSRGARIDRELEQQDQKLVAQKEAKQAQKKEHAAEHHGHHRED